MPRGKYFLHIQDENKLTIDIIMIIVGLPDMKVREIKYAHCHWKRGILDRDIIVSLQQATYIIYGPFQELLQGFKTWREIRSSVIP